MGLLAVVMVGIGLRPGLFPKVMAAPAAEVLGMQDVATTLASISFWNGADLIGMFVTLALGMLVCWAGLRSGAFHWHPPIWLTLEGLAKLAGLGFLTLWRVGAGFYRSTVTAIRAVGRTMGFRLYSACRRLDQSRSGTIGGVTLTGIGADAALLMMTLAFLIVFYTLIDLGLPNLRLPFSLSQWMRALAR